LAQTLTRGVTVGRLCPVFAAVNLQHAIAGHPAAGKRRQPPLHLRGQRGRGNIDAQFDCSGNLVHVLAARTRSTDEPFLDLRLVHGDPIADADGRSTAR